MRRLPGVSRGVLILFLVGFFPAAWRLYHILYGRGVQCARTAVLMCSVGAAYTYSMSMSKYSTRESEDARAGCVLFSFYSSVREISVGIMYLIIRKRASPTGAHQRVNITCTCTTASTAVMYPLYIHT